TGRERRYVLISRDLADAQQAHLQTHGVYCARMALRKSAAGVSSLPLRKSNSVAFSQCDPVPQRVLQPVDTQAGSQYTTPTPPTRRVMATTSFMKRCWPRNVAG